MTTTGKLIVAMLGTAFGVGGGIRGKAVRINSQRAVALVLRITTRQTWHHWNAGEIFSRCLPDRVVQRRVRPGSIGSSEVSGHRFHGYVRVIHDFPNRIQKLIRIFSREQSDVQVGPRF